MHGFIHSKCALSINIYSPRGYYLSFFYAQISAYSDQNKRTRGAYIFCDCNRVQKLGHYLYTAAFLVCPVKPPQAETFLSVFRNSLHSTPASLLVCISAVTVANNVAAVCQKFVCKIERGSLRRLQVVRDVLIGITSGGWSVRWTGLPVHSYTREPQETSLLVHSRAALWRRQAKVPLARVQRAPARSFVWRLIPVSRLDKPKRVILQWLRRSRISTRFSS